MRTGMLWMGAMALALAPLTASAQQPGQPQPGQSQLPGVQPGQPVMNLPGPIDSPQDILESARMAFVMVDADGNGAISQEEATNAGYLLVGGLFFRADADGDGVVTREEADQVREKVLQQRPILRFVFDRASRDNTPEGVEAPAGTTTSPEEIAKTIGSLLDANNDNQIQATEVRQAVATSIEGLFGVADTDRDGQLSPAELNAAMYGAVRAGVQTAFQLADQDGSGALSKEEFAQAMVQPAYTAFDILDRDLDGQLTSQELEMAAQIAVDQLDKLTVDVPRNSPVNVIGSGRLPQGSDVEITLPGRGGQPGQQPGQPARTLPATTPGQPAPAQPATAPAQPPR